MSVGPRTPLSSAPPPIQHATPQSTPSLPSLASTIISKRTSSTTISSSLFPQLPKSTHPVQTHSKSSIFKPHLNLTLLLIVAKASTDKQAQCSPLWRHTMQPKYDASIDNKTWQLTTLPLDKTVNGFKKIQMVPLIGTKPT